MYRAMKRFWNRLIRRVRSIVNHDRGPHPVKNTHYKHFVTKGLTSPHQNPFKIPLFKSP